MRKKVLAGSLKPGNGRIVTTRELMRSVPDIESAGMMPLMARGITDDVYEIWYDADASTDGMVISWSDKTHYTVLAD